MQSGRRNQAVVNESLWENHVRRMAFASAFARVAE